MKTLLVGSLITALGSSMGGAAAQTAQTRRQLDAPPEILDLGSEGQDGSISIRCTGESPYARLGCQVYFL